MKESADTVRITRKMAGTGCVAMSDPTTAETTQTLPTDA